MSYTTAAAEAKSTASALWGHGDAYRRACVDADALDRAASAEQTNRAVVSGCGKNCPPIEIIGIDRLDDARREAFLAALAEPKACGAALYALDGCKATVARRGRWIIDLARPESILAVGQWDQGCDAAPSAPVTNSHGTWAVVVWSSMPAAVLAPASEDRAWYKRSRKLLAAAQARAAESLATKGMTPRQAQDADNRRRRMIVDAAEAAKEIMAPGDPCRAQGLAYERAKETGEKLWTPESTVESLTASIVAAELARIAADREAAEMAALEAEIAAEEAAKAKAAAEAKAAESARIAAEQETKTAAMLGLLPAEWQAMPEKKRRLALHNARRTGKI